MSQFHAASRPFETDLPRLQARDPQLSRDLEHARTKRLSEHLAQILGLPLSIQAVCAVKHQGAVNGHWRLHLAEPSKALGMARSLILRCRQPLKAQGKQGDSGASGAGRAFPAQHLNSMRVQDHWHRFATAKGLQTAKSYGCLEDQEFGACLVLEDLEFTNFGAPGNPEPAQLLPLSALAFNDPDALRVPISLALSDLAAFQDMRDPKLLTLPEKALEQPPIPELEEQDWGSLQSVLPFTDGLALAETAHSAIVALRSQTRCNATDGADGRFALHGDFRLANLLQQSVQSQKRRVLLLDYDFSGLGHPAEDLGWLSAPCWSAGAAQDRALAPSWLLEHFHQLGGLAIEPIALKRSQLQAQMRWLAIALLQARRAGRSWDDLFSEQPQQHPRRVLKDALCLAEQL